MEDYFKDLIEGLKHYAQACDCEAIFEMNTKDGFKVKVSVCKLTEEGLKEQEAEEDND